MQSACNLNNFKSPAVTSSINSLVNNPITLRNVQNDCLSKTLHLASVLPTTVKNVTVGGCRSVSITSKNSYCRHR